MSQIYPLAGRVARPFPDFAASKQANIDGLALPQWVYAAGNSSGPLVSDPDWAKQIRDDYIPPGWIGDDLEQGPETGRCKSCGEAAGHR